jgi:hypothetical protein
VIKFRQRLLWAPSIKEGAPQVINPRQFFRL